MTRPDDAPPLRPEALTWTALLGRWVEYAQASASLPTEGEGGRLRDSVPAVIDLQAVTFALGDLGELPDEERPLARDKARVLVRRAGGRLDEIWRGRPMPPSILDTLRDARAALDAAAFAGAVEAVWPGPEPAVAPAVDAEREAARGGTLLLAQPGTILLPGEPAAWWVDRPPLDLPGYRARRTDRPRQIYRQLDDRGRIRRDVLRPVLDEMPPGMPLLVPIVEEGRRVGRFTVDPAEWEATQRRAAPDAAWEVVEDP